MKIIDLLNKIANGEEVPKKIKYNSKVLCYCEAAKDYDGYNGTYLFEHLFKMDNTDSFINNEIEIIEEPKKIEKLNENTSYVSTENNIGVDSSWCLNEKIIVRKINEIIDYINKETPND